jgi:hypothetical protein
MLDLKYLKKSFNHLNITHEISRFHAERLVTEETNHSHSDE